jgi:hypothetical protein
MSSVRELHTFAAKKRAEAQRILILLEYGYFEMLHGYRPDQVARSSIASGLYRSR